MNSLRLLGIVLCGGQSLRMGCDKAMLTHPSGVSYLQYAADRLAPLCQEVCLSGSPGYESGYRTLPDPVAFRGPITGVVAALTVAQRESFHGCFVTPIDMPQLAADDLGKIKEAWQNSPDRLVCGVCESPHRLQPLVAIYPTRWAEPLSKVAHSEDRSLLRWIKETDHHEVVLPRTSCHNINRPEDLNHPQTNSQE